MRLGVVLNNTLTLLPGGIRSDSKMHVTFSRGSVGQALAGP
jgi:hypothetical protein